MKDPVLIIVSLVAVSLAGCRSSHPTQAALSLAVFTPDNTSIVFSAAHGNDCFLYKAEIATGRVTRFTHAMSGCESDPAFSNDGKRVAFMRAPANGARAALIVANADDSGER